MATNHIHRLDPAITRANRFDLLLCVAPPPWSGKKSSDKLANILGIAHAKEVETELARVVTSGSKTQKLLDLFTVSEVGIFFDHLRRTQKTRNLKAALEHYTAPKFSEAVVAWANGIALREGSPTRIEYDKDVDRSRRQYYRREKPADQPLPSSVQDVSAEPAAKQKRKSSKRS